MRRGGHTLMEILVVAALSAMLVTVLLFTWFTVNSNSRTQAARIDARQDLRSALAVLRSQLQSARYVFTSYQGVFAGREYRVPAAGSPLAPADLIFAVPQSTTATNTIWKVCGLTVVPHEPPDPNNPEAYDILQQTVENVGPVLGDDPAELLPDLPTMGPAADHRFQAYIKKDSYGLIIRPLPTSVFMRFTFSLHAKDVALSKTPVDMTESFETEIFLRNQPPARP